MKGLHAERLRVSSSCLLRIGSAATSQTPNSRRHYSQKSPSSSSLAAPPPGQQNPRWLSELKSRIGRCLTFGLKPDQIAEAASILDEIANDWRELIAGSEGFLTGLGRKGLERQKVVWGEMDVMVNGHVNNVAYVRYAESARINWAQNFANYVNPAHGREWRELWSPKGDGLILRSMRTDYKFSMAWPDSISVYHKIRSAPLEETDSFLLDVIILSERHQRPAARCVEDIVVYDYRKGQKTPLRPFVREAFGQTFELQEQTKQKNTARMQHLMRRVEAIEHASWNRADAKEDLGSAS